MVTANFEKSRFAEIRLSSRIVGVMLVAVLATGCQSRGGPETTGSIGGMSLPSFGRPQSQGVITRREVESLGEKYAADSNDIALAVRYAQALRATNQKTQAVAVLQQVALRNPKNTAVLAAYGKSLAEVGRFNEAAEVLQNAHTPARPDWRVLSAQGAVADQLGDHARAQGYYEAALKIQPNDPVILSNLGLSFMLARQLPQAESSLRLAAGQPGADARVRQNLALVLGLQGKFADAEAVSRQDLTPEESAANAASLKRFVAQPTSVRAIKASDARARAADRG
ncbi:tetratricopeptide repeat protein [Methylobacterium sp. BTF04]|uniref:tetratricopeptide repeat protein n=1 Tax=Methylobacterium sp. BTF04 TaxID=2708300 RepID=UPI0013CFBB48|nr:tetratricopeptide repeat protein [Methylobacterium sp. BTF04]NEU10868.1 tetratricopeptide repeat protein [Methylobacterium sp. BTF04]